MAFRKRAYISRKKIYVYGSGSVLALIALLISFSVYGVQIDVNPESVKCGGEEKCVAYINISASDWAIKFNSKIYFDKSVNYTLYKKDAYGKWRVFNLSGKTLKNESKWELRLELEKPINEIIKYGISSGLTDKDPYFLGYSKDDFFIKLKENNADLTHAYSVFEVRNPTTKDISIDSINLGIRFEKINNLGLRNTEISIYVPNGYEKNISNWTVEYVNKSIRDNSTKKNYTIQVLEWVNHPYYEYYYGSQIGETYNYSRINLNYETMENNTTIVNKTREYLIKNGTNPIYDYWIDINNLSGFVFKAKTNYTIKLEADYPAKLGRRELDWMPYINISGIELKQDTWAWWNSAWSRCKNITLTHSNGVINAVPVLMNVTYDADMANGFSDLRFVNASCSNDGTRLGHLIQNFSASSYADVWVNVTPEVTNTIISVYYNNASGVADVSNGAEVFDAWDSCDSATLNTTVWNQISTGNYSAVNGWCKLAPTSDAYNKNIIDTVKTFNDNHSFFARFRVNATGSAGAPIQMGFATDGCTTNDHGDCVTGSYHYVQFWADGTIGGEGGGASWKNWGASSTFWYTLETERNNSNAARYYENGTFIATAGSTSGQGNALAAAIRQRSGGTTNLEIDYAYVRKIAPFPITTAFGTEQSSGDSIKPGIIINYPSNNTAYGTQSNISVNYTASDDVAIDKCFLQIDTGANASVASCANTSTGVLTDGNHNITIWVNDTTNNANWTRINISLDGNPPDITLQSPANATYYRPVKNITLNFTITDANKDKCWYELDGKITSFSNGLFYRINLTLTNTAGNQTNYPQKLSIDTYTLNSSAGINRVAIKPDCSNMRFYWVNRSNQNEVLLNAYNYSCSMTSGINSTFWVNATEIGNSTNNTIYLYFGNDSFSSVFNGTKTFDKFDDFNSYDTLISLSGQPNGIWYNASGGRGGEGNTRVHNTTPYEGYAFVNDTAGDSVGVATNLTIATLKNIFVEIMSLKNDTGATVISYSLFDTQTPDSGTSTNIITSVGLGETTVRWRDQTVAWQNSVSITMNQWYSLRWEIFPNNSIKLYVNNSMVNASAISTITTGVQSFTMGHSGSAKAFTDRVIIGKYIEGITVKTGGIEAIRDVNIANCNNATLFFNPANLSLGGHNITVFVNDTWDKKNWTTNSFSINTAQANISLYLNGTQGNVSYEQGTNISINATSQSGVIIYLDINQTGYGINYTSGTTYVLYELGTNYSIKDDFNDSTKTQNANYTSSPENKTVNIKMHKYDEIGIVYINLSGADVSGNVSNITIFINDSADKRFYGRLLGGIFYLDFMNNSLTAENLSFVPIGGLTRYFTLPKGKNVTNANLTLTPQAGYYESIASGTANLTIQNNATETTICGNVTYDQILITNSTIGICNYTQTNMSTGWANLIANNITIRNTTINAGARGWFGGNSTNSNCQGGNAGQGLGKGQAGQSGVVNGYGTCYPSSPATGGGGGAGGSGYAVDGGSGGIGGRGTNEGGGGGSSYGSAVSDIMNNNSMGSGGGSGGASASGPGNKGEQGGGAVRLRSGNANITGNIFNFFGGVGGAGAIGGDSACTSSPLQADPAGGGGGGSSGGLVIISAGNISISNNIFNASQGIGGAGKANGNCPGWSITYSGNGTNGSAGYIKLYYNSLIANTSNTFKGTVQTAILGSPENITIDIGNDGTNDYNYTGTMTTAQNANFNTSPFISYLGACSQDRFGLCDVPMGISSQGAGIVQISNINISYRANPIELNYTLFERFQNNSAGFVDFPIKFTSTSNGQLSVNGINISYHGSDNITILAHTESGNYTSNNASYEARIRYSRFRLIYPNYTDVIMFAPENTSDKNVTPFGQTNDIPIWNVTSLAYDSNFNVSIWVNETQSCRNVTIANTSNTTGGVYLNTTPYQIKTNISVFSTVVSNSTGIWMWENLNNCDWTTAIKEVTYYISAVCLSCLYDNGV